MSAGYDTLDLLYQALGLKLPLPKAIRDNQQRGWFGKLCTFYKIFED